MAESATRTRGVVDGRASVSVSPSWMLGSRYAAASSSRERLGLSQRPRSHGGVDSAWR